MTCRRAPRGWFAVLAALALAACDPSPSPSSSVVAAPTPTDAAVASVEPASTQAVVAKPAAACEIVFKAEVAAAIGVSIDDAQEIPASSTGGSDWLTDCIYWRQTFHDLAPLELTVGSGAQYVTFFDDLKGLAGVSPEPDLGDEALLHAATIAGLDGPVDELYVRVGGTVIGLTLGIVDLADDGTPKLPGDASQQATVLRGLAALVLQRLTGPPVESAKACDLVGAAAAGTLLGLPIASAADVDDHDVWGPSCRYVDPTGPNANTSWIDFWVAISAAPSAKPHLEACRAGGEVVPGLGDDAFFVTYGAPADCGVKIGFYFDARPLMIRSGDLVVALGDGGEHPLLGVDRRDRILAFARAVLDKLGTGPGTTLPPVNADALVHPCGLLSEAELGGIVGVQITAHDEDSADASGQHATCYFHAKGDSGVMPLILTLGKGTDALRRFNSDVKQNSYYQPVAGVGDEAYSSQTTGQADQPLVDIVVRRGDAVLRMSLGPVRQSSDFITYLAAGTPDAQLQMLRQLSELVLPRIAGG